MNQLFVPDDFRACFSDISCHRDPIFLFSDEKIKCRNTSKRLFGKERFPCEYYGLTGALGRTELFVGVWKKALYLEYYEHERIGLTGSCLLGQKQGRLFLVNRHCRILSPAMRRQGIGFLWFRRQKETSERLGIDKIISYAARSSESCGYYSLPRYGFDSMIPPAIRQKLPRNLKSCQTILHLFETPTGRHWWKHNGVSVEVVFDMSRNSASQKMLAFYLNETAATVASSPTSVGLAGADTHGSSF